MPVDSKVGRRHLGWLILLVTFWKFQHFNLVSKIFQKLFKPLPCHKSIGKMMHAICISAVAVSLRWASCGPWASCFYLSTKTCCGLCGYSLEAPHRVASMSTHNNIMFSWRNQKNISTMYFWAEKRGLSGAVYLATLLSGMSQWRNILTHQKT